MLRLERCYYLHFTRHSELLRGSLITYRAMNIRLISVRRSRQQEVKLYES